MIKNNPRIKENISFIDEINAIETIVSSYFTEKDNIVEYTPYYSQMSTFFAIIENFLDGVELNENEDSFETIVSDKEIYNLIKRFYYNTEKFKNTEKDNKENSEYIDLLNRVLLNVNDIVEFKKQKLIHRDHKLRLKQASGYEAIEKLSSYFEVIAGALYNFSKLDLRVLSPENFNLAKDVMTKLKESDMTEESISKIIKDAIGFNMDKASEEIIDSKNEQIREKDKRIKALVGQVTDLRKYKEQNESKNVLTE